jgi:hypothetical protein
MLVVVGPGKGGAPEPGCGNRESYTSILFPTRLSRRKVAVIRRGGGDPAGWLSSRGMGMLTADIEDEKDV